MMSQDEDDGGSGGAKIRPLLRRKSGLRKDLGMPIGYGRMLDVYVVELGGDWQEDGQVSLERRLLPLRLNRTH